MDQKKRTLIDSLSEKVKTIPKDELLPFFLAVTQKMKKENITFSKDELDELMTLFEANATEQEKKQLRLVKELMDH